MRVNDCSFKGGMENVVQSLQTEIFMYITLSTFEMFLISVNFPFTNVLLYSIFVYKRGSTSKKRIIIGPILPYKH